MDYYEFFHLAVSSNFSFQQTVDYLNCWFVPSQEIADELNRNISLLLNRTIPSAILLAVVAYRHDILILLANYFGDTLRIVYRMLRAVQLRSISGEGDITQRPTNADKSEVWTRDHGCVITGHDSVSLPPQYAHIIPYAIVKYSIPHSDYFNGIRMVFGETVYKNIWERCGGPNCNSRDNLTSYSPNMHGMIDSQQMFLWPMMLNRLMSSTDIVDLENQLPPGQVLKFDCMVEFWEKGEQETNKHTTKRTIVGAGPGIFWRSIDDGTVLTNIEPGYALAQAVSATLGRWAAMEDFRDAYGERADLGHWAAN